VTAGGRPADQSVTRPVLRRLFGSFCMLWFAISVAKPALLHACPMHDVVTPAATPTAPASHHQHGATAVDASAPDDAGHASCTCVGECAAAASLGMLAPGVALLEASVVAMTDAGLPDHAYVPVARALLLPFANGPPSLPPSQRV